MITELLNQAELAVLVNGTPVAEGHAGLYAALQARYPGTRFQLIAVRGGYSWGDGLVDSNGTRITDNLVSWIDQELCAAGHDARAVWQRHNAAGLIRTAWQGERLVFTVPFGQEPEAFQQIDIFAGVEKTIQQFLATDSRFAPEDRADLIAGHSLVFGPHEQKQLSPPRYSFSGMTNIRRFLRELLEIDRAEQADKRPDLAARSVRVLTLAADGQHEETVPFLELFPAEITSKPPAFRLFEDWQESSAGRAGHRFCDHWYVQHSVYTDQEGKRSYYFCPQWADGGIHLPKLSPTNEASPYGVMASLEAFDQQAGYPFAWYFYMLHGNRVSPSAGGVIARAIQNGEINPLPEWDSGVLLRWHEHPYGF